MSDQTPSAPIADDPAADAAFRASVHSRVRAGMAATIARISETNNATLEAQGKPLPAQGHTKSNQGGRSVKMNADGTFSHTVTHGNPGDDSISPDLSAAASRQSQKSLLDRINAINKQINDSHYYDQKTGERKSHMSEDQYRRYLLEYNTLAKAHEAQAQTTATLEAQEARHDQLKDMAISREQAIRDYGNGDPAREKALRAHLADLEAKDVATTIYHAYRK